MTWEFIRREWGAVTFVLTVIVGMIVVPLALYFTNQGPHPVAVPISSPTPSISTGSAARASGVHSPTPTAASPSPAATKSP